MSSRKRYEEDEILGLISSFPKGDFPPSVVVDRKSIVEIRDDVYPCPVIESNAPGTLGLFAHFDRLGEPDHEWDLSDASTILRFLDNGYGPFLDLFFMKMGGRAWVFYSIVRIHRVTKRETDKALSGPVWNFKIWEIFLVPVFTTVFVVFALYGAYALFLK
jgi:hypothetical protein